MTRAAFCSLIPLALSAVTLAQPSPQQADTPRPRQGASPEVIATMPAIAQALGVTCRYCHVARRGQPRVPEPKKDIALAMMLMTREINSKVQAASGKSAGQATEVQCVTCHRGVTIPGQLTDILTKTAVEKSVDAAIAQYRELRGLYYGRQSYDFGEETLITVAQHLLYHDPEEAIAMLQLNLEFNPKSATTYSHLATAYQRKFDEKSAISCLEKALEIEPDNSLLKGQLAQLKSYKRNQ